MRVLVTGGSGFIGSNVVEQLLGDGHAVGNFDIRPPKRDEHTSCWLAGDIRNADAIAGAVAQFVPELVLHLAAKADISSSDWEDFASIHRGTQNLLSAIDQTGSVRILANISTQLTIGPRFVPRSLTDFRPYTIYGDAKAYAEGLLMQWQNDLTWLTIRPANIWGPHHPSFAQEIWRYIGARQYLHPSGEPVYRSYGYVENSARQIIDLATADKHKVHRQIFYAADAVLDSARWIDAFAERLTGRPARRVPASLLKTLGLSGDVAKRIGLPAPIDSGRAMRMTESYPVPLERTFDVVGSPAISMDEGADRTVAWLRSLQRSAASAGG